MVQVRIDQPEYVIQENQGPLSVCMTLIEANIERNLVVILSPSDGTAQGKSHFLTIIMLFMLECKIILLVYSYA